MTFTIHEYVARGDFTGLVGALELAELQAGLAQRGLCAPRNDAIQALVLRAVHRASRQSLQFVAAGGAPPCPHGGEPARGCSVPLEAGARGRQGRQRHPVCVLPPAAMPLGPGLPGLLGGPPGAQMDWGRGADRRGTWRPAPGEASRPCPALRPSSMGGLNRM